MISVHRDLCQVPKWPALVQAAAALRRANPVGTAQKLLLAHCRWLQSNIAQLRGVGPQFYCDLCVPSAIAQLLAEEPEYRLDLMYLLHHFRHT